MKSEMVKMAQYDTRDGQKGSYCRQRWSKGSVGLEIWSKYGIRDGQKGSLSL